MNDSGTEVQACACNEADGSLRAYRIVGITWCFHGSGDRVRLALILFRNGPVAVRSVSVKTKLPHIPDDLASMVDGFVESATKRALSERWIIEEVELRLSRRPPTFMFEVLPQPIYGCVHRTEVATANRAADIYLNRTWWVEHLTGKSDD